MKAGNEGPLPPLSYSERRVSPATVDQEAGKKKSELVFYPSKKRHMADLL
jgi:hypothetical protein